MTQQPAPNLYGSDCSALNRRARSPERRYRPQCAADDGRVRGITRGLTSPAPDTEPAVVEIDVVDAPQPRIVDAQLGVIVHGHAREIARDGRSLVTATAERTRDGAALHLLEGPANRPPSRRGREARDRTPHSDTQCPQHRPCANIPSRHVRDRRLDDARDPLGKRRPSRSDRPEHSGEPGWDTRSTMRDHSEHPCGHQGRGARSGQVGGLLVEHAAWPLCRAPTRSAATRPRRSACCGRGVSRARHRALNHSVRMTRGGGCAA